MIKNIGYRIYGALLSWHVSRGMTCTKMAQEYTLISAKHLKKAQKYADKLSVVVPVMKEES